MTTGLTELNANNLTMGNLPIARFNSGENASATTFWSGTGGPTGFGAWLPVSASGAVVGPGSSLDNQIVLFDGTTGSVIKGATGTGFVYATDGVYSIAELDQIGVWSILTNGDTVTPEIVFDSLRGRDQHVYGGGMSTLSTCISRDIRANQPAASAVPVGSLFGVTDEGQHHRTVERGHLGQLLPHSRRRCHRAGLEHGQRHCPV